MILDHADRQLAPEQLTQKPAKKLLNDTEDATLSLAIELEGQAYSRGARTEPAGLTGTTWPVTSQSNR